MKGVVAREEERVDDFGENLLTSMGYFSHRMSYWRFFEKRLLIFAGHSISMSSLRREAVAKGGGFLPWY